MRVTHPGRWFLNVSMPTTTIILQSRITVNSDAALAHSKANQLRAWGTSMRQTAIKRQQSRRENSVHR